ncbi:MAG: UTRA domain-containing protein [Acetobacteraceae bacterium]
MPPRAWCAAIDAPGRWLRARRAGAPCSRSGTSAPRFAARAATAADARRLGVAAGSRVLATTTRHLSDGVAVQLEDRLVHLGAAPAAAEEPFAAAPPGRWLLDHVPWTQAEHAISAENAPPRVAARLGIAPGAACLVVERRTWNGDAPVTFARLWHPGTRHRLVGRFAA